MVERDSLTYFGSASGGRDIRHNGTLVNDIQHDIKTFNTQNNDNEYLCRVSIQLKVTEVKGRLPERVVKHLTREDEVKGLCPATAGTGREKM